MLELATNRQPILPCIASLFEALHEHAIRYCHLKGNPQHLKVSLSGESDIDVLFDRKQKAAIESVLSGLGFKEFKAIKAKQLKDVVDFITLDGGSGRVIHLHSYYAITIGEPYLRGYQVGQPELILRNRVFNEAFGTYCIPPAFELTFLYLSEILKLRHRDYLDIYLNNKITISDKVTNQYSWLKKNTTPAEIDAAFKSVFDNHAPISDLVKAGLSSAQLRKLAPLIKKGSRRFRSYSPAVALAVRWKREVTIRLRRKLSRLLSWPIPGARINPRGGVVVAVIGGERNARQVVGLLVEAFRKKLDVYKVSFEAQTRATDGSEIQLNTKTKSSTISRAMRSFILGWKNNLKLKKIQSARKQGILVICHRFPQDLLISHKEGIGSKLPDSAGKFAPDLELKVATGKPAPQTFDGQNSYHEVQSSMSGSKIVTVYGDRPLNEVVSIVKKEIWSIL